MTAVVKIPSHNNKERPLPKIKWNMLEKNDCAIKFRERVVDRMIEMGDMNDRSINERWNEIAGCIRQAAKDILGETSGKGTIDRDTWWWSTEVQNVLKEKKRAFKEWQCLEPGNSNLKAVKKAEYDLLKKKAKKAVAIAKSKAQDKLYHTVDSPADQKELYRLTRMRERKTRDVCHVRCIKDIKSVGLKLSRTKTEYLFCDFGGLQSCLPLALTGTPIPICSVFRYLLVSCPRPRRIASDQLRMDEMATGHWNNL
ncbi:hypothetical protein PYW07_000397 [Mythimna separata]|uniref:Uncharacterized protein n=1 Tax=Mythimna separata TaxID=271217 RepID=A0AAD8E0I0_MYTSE|nr:hypothetical protein PYW07_000397 [Mythimna separata]